MPKRIIILLFLFSYLKLTAQQSNIYGVVSIFNSKIKTGKRLYVSNAQVEDDFKKAQPTITNNKGQFKLTYIGLNEKTSVSFQVKKSGLQVVNIDALFAITGQNDTIKISMANPDSIAEYRRTIYNIGKTQAEKNLEALIEKKNKDLLYLRKNNQQNLDTIKLLEKELNRLEAYKPKIDEQAQDLAKKYTPVNLDDASSLFSEAFALFQKGNLDSAQLLLKLADLPLKVDGILLEERKIENRKKELTEIDSLKNQRKKEYAEGLLLKADLHKTKYEFDSASKCYELLIKMDSLNTDYLINYAYFNQWLNQYNKAIYYFSKILKICEKNYLSNRHLYGYDLAVTQFNLGVLYSDKNDFVKAESFYFKCLRIFQSLSNNNPKIYKVLVVGTKVNLGMLYLKKKNYVKAEALYLEALQTYESLINSGQKNFETNMANLQNDLGVLYVATNNYPRAEAAYLKALEIRIRLAKNDPIIYELDLSITYNNLGNLYLNNNDYVKAEHNFNEALQIIKRLAEISPQSYEPDVAQINHNLGNLFYKKHDFIKSQEAYQSALKIRIRLAAEDSQTYEPIVARTLNNLGNLYCEIKNYSEAEDSYKKVLEIYTRLFKVNPQIYEFNIAMTQNNLGNVFSYKKENVNAKKAYLASLEIYKRLAKASPKVYKPDLAMTFDNLGSLYSDINDYDSGEKAYLEALEIRKYLFLVNPKRFEIDLATTENNLGLLSLKMKKFIQSENLLTESLTIREKWMHKYPDVYRTDVIQTIKNLLDMYASILDVYQYEAFQKTKQDNFEKVEKFLINESRKDQEIGQKLMSYYNNRSWYLLFAKKFKEAEKVARRGFSLDTSNLFLKIHLAHSLLLQENYKDAFNIYQELKSLNEASNFFIKICLDELNEIEKKGLGNKYVNKIRDFLKNYK